MHSHAADDRGEQRAGPWGRRGGGGSGASAPPDKRQAGGKYGKVTKDAAVMVLITQTLILDELDARDSQNDMSFCSPEKHIELVSGARVT